jgi:SAM-dependent methyltransferase
MVDPRPGNALLAIGADAPALTARAAAVTGLNGRTVVVARGADDRRRIDAAAASEGALVEFIDAPAAMLPFDPDTFDVAFIADVSKYQGAAGAIVAEALRVTRPAGRLILVTQQKRGGLFGAVGASAAVLPADTILAMLKSAGAVAVRKLADVDGSTYYEGRKPRG